MVSEFRRARGFDGIVRALAPVGDGSGDVYVGGNFLSYDAVIVDRIALVGPNGTAL